MLDQLIAHLRRMAHDPLRLAAARVRHGAYLEQLGESSAAREEFRQAVAELPDEDESLPEALIGWGEVHLELGSEVQAQAAFQRASALLKEDPVLRPRLLRGRARLCIAQGRFPRAERLLETALDGISSGHPERARCLEARAFLLQARGQAAHAAGVALPENEEAGALLKEAVAAQEEIFGASHPFLVPPLLALGKWHRDRGQSVEASECARRALETTAAHLPSGHPWLRQARAQAD